MADSKEESTQKDTGSGITSHRIQNILNGIDEEVQLNVSQNIMHEYDNPNYHIKFYMVDQDAAHTYMRDRRELNNTSKVSRAIIDKIHNNGSIIIAETGKTEDIIIESMTVETITSVPGRGISTTAEITLKLKELGGCSLINKITYASKKLGQDSYVLSYYFIDLWFSGYKNYEYQTKTIEERIPFISNSLGTDGDGTNDNDSSGEFLTYAMIISEMKTEKEGLNTNYTIKMVGTNFNLQIPNISTINMEKLKIEKGGTFKDTIGNLEEKLNETLKGNLNSEAKKIYEGKDIIEFNIINNSKNERADDISKTEESNIPNVDNKEIIKTNQDATKQVQPNGKGQQPTKTESSQQQGTAAKTDKDFNLDETDNIYTAVNKIWNVLEPMSGHIPVVNIYQIALDGGKVENRYNMLYPQYIVDIEILEYPGLEMRKEGMKKDANPTWSERILDEQLEILKSLSKYNSLKRRYYNQYSGQNIDVLDITEKDDTMWYMNVSTGEEKLVSENSPNSSQNSKNDSTERTEVKDEVDKSDITKSNTQLTINDLWYEGIKNGLKIEDTIRTGAIGFVNIFEPQDSNNPTGNEKQEDVNAKKTGEDELQAIARIGAENFFSSAQKIELKLKIIGDPYWLEFGSEMRGNIFCNAFPHVIFVYDVPHKLDEQDNYIRDEKMKWATLYKVLNIKSHFDNGSFTQDITGVVCPSFVFKENFKSAPIHQKADETVQAGVSTADSNKTDVMEINANEYIKTKDDFFTDVKIEYSEDQDKNPHVGFINEDKMEYYIDKNGNMILIDRDLTLGGMKQDLAVVDKSKYDWQIYGNILIITNRETGEYIKYTKFEKIDPLDNSSDRGNETYLWNVSDGNGNIDGKDLIYHKNANGDYDIYAKDENGKSVKVSDLNYGYNVIETVNADGSVDINVENKKTGKVYNVKGIKDGSYDIVESVKATANGTFADNSVGLLRNKVIYDVNASDDSPNKNVLIVDSMVENKTTPIRLGHFEEDGYHKSRYAEVTTPDGKTVECYSVKYFDEAISGNVKYTFTIKELTRKAWGFDETKNIMTYNAAINDTTIAEASKRVIEQEHTKLNYKRVTHSGIE